MGVVQVQNGRGQKFPRTLRAIILFWPLRPSSSSYAYDYILLCTPQNPALCTIQWPWSSAKFKISHSLVPTLVWFIWSLKDLTYCRKGSSDTNVMLGSLTVLSTTKSNMEILSTNHEIVKGITQVHGAHYTYLHQGPNVYSMLQPSSVVSKTGLVDRPQP